MPKKHEHDPITDKEIAFAHLLLSGTMNDREAAEASGLNPATAAYTKAKPRVREYMNNHRAAVSQKLIDQEAQGLRSLNIGRDQIVARLWQLANLDPAETKGSINGQLKAIALIASIEGLIANRHGQASPQEQPDSHAIKPHIYVSEWMRNRPDNPTDATEIVTAVDTKPASTAPPEPPPPAPPQSNIPPVSQDPARGLPSGLSWAPNATGLSLDSYSKPSLPVGLPSGPGARRFGRRR